MGECYCEDPHQDLPQVVLESWLLWLGWLRTMECFDLSWTDCSSTSAFRGRERDLPEGIGMLSLLLGPETKSDRTRRPDVVLASHTRAGFRPLRWLRRARSICGYPAGSSLVFRHADGSQWSSLFFRQHYLYLCLRRLQSEGDAYLRPLTTGANSIEARFWSLHCYRRGARTHVSRPIPGLRHASKDQVYEHARWRC